MKVIYKYALPVTGRPSIAMPKGAQILQLQVKRGKPYIWALVDPYANKEDRRFIVVGTDHTIHQIEIDNIKNYIGTFQMDKGDLVFHVFEVRI